MFLKAIALEINIPVLEGSTRRNTARLDIICRK